MKLYEMHLRPTSALGTPLKGDTIFGHFCWQAAHDSSLLEGGLKGALSVYGEQPFAIFSSAFPVFADDSKRILALKKPSLPIGFFTTEHPKARLEFFKSAKGFKKKKWLLTESLKFDLAKMKLVTDEELVKKAANYQPSGMRRRLEKTGQQDFMITDNHTHNSLNRLTQSTGTGQFAPYVQEDTYYLPETELAIFVLFDEEFTDTSRIKKGMERIGQWGYGRDASTGKGRFTISYAKEVPLPDPDGANACYAMGPACPEKNVFKYIYFRSFVRFGKHGDLLAKSANPFKKPILFADEAAVFVPKDQKMFNKPYLGSAVKDVSLVQSEAVAQGYTIYLPLKLEENHVR